MIMGGTYETPVVSGLLDEDFVEQFKDGEIELDDWEYDDFDDLDEEDLRYYYLSFMSDEYYDWVCEHDHRFIAEL